MRLKWIITTLFLTLVLAACSSDVPSSTFDAEEPSAAEGSDSGAEATNRLDADYDEALPVLLQLGIGSIQLENTEMAITEAQAEVILPLWQALQALSQSETTAEAELNAVTNQIQDEMNADQIAYIADLQLTEASVQEMVESGELAIGRGRGGQGGQPGGQPGGGGRGGQGGGLLGGGGGGGRGGQGGGLLGGGGPPADGGGGEGGGPNGGDFAAFMGRAMMAGTIRMLQTKLGQEVQGGPGGRGGNDQNNPNFIAANAIAEALGLTLEAYREKFTDETITPAAVIAAEGGDLDAIKTILMDALADTELGQSAEFEARLDTYLTGE